MTWLAVVLALASAATVAFSTSVQHQAAENAPESAEGAWGLLRHLVRRPAWLIGQVLGVVALVFHALALNTGPIALVQPIIISGIVLAVPVRSMLSRTWPGRKELAAVGLAAAGLAAFLIASDPKHGESTASGWLPGAMVLVSVAIAAALILVARRVIADTPRAFMLGAGAGILFGLVAVLIKMCSNQLADDGVSAIFTSWPLYTLVVVGLSGVFTNQIAYRSARLSASMPVLNIVDGMLALGFGYAVFQEVPRHDLVALVVEIPALVAIATGLWVLAQYEEAFVVEPALADRLSARAPHQ